MLYINCTSVKEERKAGVPWWFSGLKIQHCLSLLWLWRRPVDTAPIQPLAWEPPYAAGAAQEIATTTTTTTTKDKKKKKELEDRDKFQP